MSKDKVDQSGFQLDKKELTKGLGFPIKQAVEGFVDFVNGLDANHDGKADLCQIAPYVVQALPILAALAPLVDLDKLVDWFVNHDFIKDKEEAAKHLTEALQMGLAAAAAVTEAKK